MLRKQVPVDVVLNTPDGSQKPNAMETADEELGRHINADAMEQHSSKTRQMEASLFLPPLCLRQKNRSFRWHLQQRVKKILHVNKGKDITAGNILKQDKANQDELARWFNENMQDVKKMLRGSVGWQIMQSSMQICYLPLRHVLPGLNCIAKPYAH